MTLDEAIKHCEEVAEEKKEKACNLYDTKAYEESRECIWCAEEHRQLSEWLKELKQLREQTRWIPVSSERLPKVADCYAVTRQIGSDLITSACYFDGINTWHNDNWINYERNYLIDIIAWMPLPQPYKPEKGGEK